jgi:PAS domain-containing protein
MSEKPTYEELEQRVRELEAVESGHNKAHETLLEGETKYRNLFENMIDEVHLWKLVRDTHGKIKTWRLVDINPAGLKAWGKTRAEPVGKTADEIFPDPNATAHLMPIVQKVFTDGKPHIWESYFEGTNQYLHMTSVPFGEYFISTGVDIT